MIGLDHYTPSKILSYMGTPCLAVARFMGVIGTLIAKLAQRSRQHLGVSSSSGDPVGGLVR
jgi:hypothetical protein